MTRRSSSYGSSTLGTPTSRTIELPAGVQPVPSRRRLLLGVALAAMCTVGSLSLLALGEIALGVIMLVIAAGGAVGVWAIAAQRRTVRRAVVTVIGLSTLVLGALAFREGFTGSALLSVVSGLVMLGELFNDDKGPTSDGVVLVLD